MILKGEFSDTCQLRTHVDANEDELTIVCDYSEHDLLSLVQKKIESISKARKCIFQQVGQAVDSFHAKNWIHSGWLQEIYHSTTSPLARILSRHEA